MTTSPSSKGERTGPQKRAALWHALRTVFLWALVFLLLLSVTPQGRSVWEALFQASGFTVKAEEPLSIHVLDVGKADAILIRCEGHAALIDAGTYLDGETVADYLSRGGFPALDYAVASHPDKDHLGGMAQVLSETEVKNFVRSAWFPEKYAAVKQVLEEKAIPCRTVSPGDVLPLGGAVLRVLGPGKEYSDTNNASLVLRLEYQGFTALFCGDIEEDAERDLVKSGADLSADVLKVPHHGSKTSCTKRFLAEAAPRYAVISVGPDNHELPDEQTLLRLENAGIEEIYRTDTDGTVVFTYDGSTIGIKTEQ